MSFKKPLQRFTEDEEEDYFEEKSCPQNCCDGDCECDDCTRCSENRFAGLDDYAAA